MKRGIHLSPGKCLALCLWLALILVCFAHRDALTIEGIVTFTPDEPLRAAAVMLGLFALKGITVFINGNLLYAAGGVMFPLPGALLVNAAGTVIMTAIPFFIGRAGGEATVEALTQKHRTLAALRDAPRRSAFSVTFFLRVLGLLPCEPVGLYLGACGIRYGSYLCGTMLGLFPVAAAYTVIGEYAAQPRSPQFIVAVCVRVGITLCALTVGYLHRRKTRESLPLSHRK
ncbi:MAG: VTT domain-containing protein [Oscillospiraceae bacterium]|nr:VTT domain-containing protein [Oscillospiraceae bacterium]